MTHQTFFENMNDHTQTEMLAEFSGKDGKKDKLIDAEHFKEQLELKKEIQENIDKGQQYLI